ncbi:LysR family transcriptional regulator [Paraburkholderia sp. UCT31]|uniref:LysR family transcriptional regulator n=1 Tax=Paraburkholderia sp. UCT31 TaxID=2615209 RepID=UPI001655582D|nr:LysR family transcriptional regulator [Paraburkholderia sp. UCT31]MBC8742605.1 LysR family transcriptional regulator [Paraburkholderia sp. UCT31]
MNIRFLETFVWLAKLQNFRLTAEKLHTTQAAVSSRIASLEESFDVRLFDRNSRLATLTLAGRKMLAYAERIVRLGEEMRREVGDAEDEGGLIRIGVIESIVHSWFPALMGLIRERYPRLEIEVTSDTTIHLAHLLRTDVVELILQTDAMTGPDFTNLPLCEFPVRWFASPTLGLSSQTLELTRLAEFPIVSFSRHSGPHATLEKLFAAAVERPARINCITSVAAMIRLVADGFGVAALPPAIIQRELREGALEVLDVQTDFPPLPLVAVHRAQSHPLAAGIAELARQAASEFTATLEDDTIAASKARRGKQASPAGRSTKS